MHSAFAGLLGVDSAQVWRPRKPVILFHGGERVTKFDLAHFKDANQPCVFFTVSEEIAEDYANDWVTKAQADFRRVFVVTGAAWQMGAVDLAKLALERIDAVLIEADPGADDELWREDVYCVLNTTCLRVVGARQVD